MALPPPIERGDVPRVDRPVVFAAVIGGGVALVVAIVGLVILGWKTEQDTQIASTGLATIGATLAGAFAAWMGARRRDDESDRR